MFRAFNGMSDWMGYLGAFPQGSAGTCSGCFNSPSGAFIDPNGILYIADTGNHRIQRFDATNNRVTQFEVTFLNAWGGFGTGNGQFKSPYDMAATDSYVYVADTGNNRIQKFTTSGMFVSAWGSLGIGPGQFNGPRGVGVDPWGNVFVADTENHRIQKFDANGNFITAWGGLGTGALQFNRPYSVAIANDGRVFVADYDNARFRAFDVAP